jgi:phosphopantothenoylcysteine decarboxylase/phosphopantothenate--cysteine ligase
MNFKGKKIILGITGGIAAYKAILLLRLLKKMNADVQVILTPRATKFVSSLTLSVLSEKKVLVEMADQNQWNNHVTLGLWADLMIIYPATANTISKMASGFCDNLLLSVYLSAQCPIIVCPAMDCDMYEHPSVKKNLDTLENYQNYILKPNYGQLASGLEGYGRLKEPEEVIDFLNFFFFQKKSFQNKNVLITAGPTQEPIDPVRFISNYSSGKMGYSLAAEIAKRGGNVVLVTGPTYLQHPKNVQKIINVKTASQMLDACLLHADVTDIFIFAAAVSDYSPADYSEIKLKKNDNELILKLKKNPDIASIICHQKRKNQFAIGFALETNHEIANAKNKLESKKLNAIILNSLNTQGSGFSHDTNKIFILDHNGLILETELLPKTEIAKIIADYIENCLNLNQ